MTNKSKLKSRLSSDDKKQLAQILVDMNLWRPVWFFMSDLFDGITKEEWMAVQVDLEHLSLTLKLTDPEIDLSYLLSLAKSFGLLSERLTVEMFESFGGIYNFITDSGLAIHSMYEQLTGQFDYPTT